MNFQIVVSLTFIELGEDEERPEWDWLKKKK